MEAALTTIAGEPWWLVIASVFERRNRAMKLNLVPHIAALQAAFIIIVLILQGG